MDHRSDLQKGKLMRKIDKYLNSAIVLTFLFAVALVKRIVRTNLSPKLGGMVHMVNMGELVNNYVIAKWFRHFHEANIERNGAG